MRDFKHLSGRKRYSFPSLFGHKKKRPANSFRKLKESKGRQGRLHYILPLIAFVLAGYPVFFLLTSIDAAKLNTGSFMAKKSVMPSGLTLDSNQSFQLAIASMERAAPEGDRLVSSLHDGGAVLYTIDQHVQNRVKKVMEDFQVPYGVFVAMEPKTGRILALASHSSGDPQWARNSFFNLYPMASLFKIITASAALEQKKVAPDTVFAFRGSSYSENPKYWSVKPGSASQQMSLSQAMGKSINPVFGRLASDVVGKDSIMTYAHRFGFNQTLFPGIPVIPSKAEAPMDDDALKLMGAGLGREVKISPIHAAAMIAAIANNGVMMTPVLADEIKNSSGRVIYAQKPQPLRRLVNPEAADQLERMLSTTVNSGTSRKAFHDRRGRPKLASINICAKTGSINGKEPEGSYTWFAGYAPAEDPQIAVVALVINQDRWKIKASYLGEQSLEAFFKE
jgi:cell division protein FtsI/penicillin-binding protein 2